MNNTSSVLAVSPIKAEGKANECDNIKNGVKQIGQKGVGWVHMASDRVE
jgi:hypothetical protein